MRNVCCKCDSDNSESDTSRSDTGSKHDDLSANTEDIDSSLNSDVDGKGLPEFPGVCEVATPKLVYDPDAQSDLSTIAGIIGQVVMVILGMSQLACFHSQCEEDQISAARWNGDTPDFAGVTLTLILTRTRS